MHNINFDALPLEYKLLIAFIYSAQLIAVLDLNLINK